MKTIIYTLNDPSDVVYKHAGEVIRAGGLVVLPTETVYGIGANALSKDAAQKIYQVKGRPSDNPLIVHVAEINDVYKYVEEINKNSLILMDKFWPGPLTLIMKKNNLIPNEITGGLPSVAIRMPNNEMALNVIKAANLPICAPSANISGRPSSTLFNHVVEDFMGKVDIIIDGGKSTIGLESTVLDMTSETPTILRPGAITKEMIEKVLGIQIHVARYYEDKLEAPKSPGMKYTHYSPKGQVTLVYGDREKVINYINDKVEEKEKASRVAVICASEYENEIKCVNKIIIGSVMNPNQIAANLFIALREMDNLKIDYIYTHSFPTENIGLATMNRLLKAAGNNIINLDK